MNQIQKRINQIGDLFGAIAKSGVGQAYRTVIALSEPYPIIETFNNDLGKFSGVKNDALFNSVKEGHWHESHFMDLTQILFNDDWNIVDLGANIGTHTIHCARLAHSGKVFSFEPQSLTYAILQKNIIQNDCNNVVPYKFAVSNVSDEILSMDLFSYEGDLVNNGVVRVSGNGGLGDKTLTTKLDDMNLPKIDFIKIDIQGSEVKALQGATTLISRDRPFLFVEIEEQHLKSLGHSSKELIDFILSLGYVLFRVKTDYPCDHICVPTEYCGDFKDKILPNYHYELDEIAGHSVQLKFENNTDQNYSEIEVI